MDIFIDFLEYPTKTFLKIFILAKISPTLYGHFYAHFGGGIFKNFYYFFIMRNIAPTIWTF